MIIIYIVVNGTLIQKIIVIATNSTISILTKRKHPKMTYNSLYARLINLSLGLQ